MILLIAISVALGLAWMFRVRPLPFSDYYDYYLLARDLINERQFGYPLSTARRLPGFPALLALAMSISRSFFWLWLLNVMLAAALLPVVHRLAFSLTGNRRAALTAAAVCALNPTFVFFSPIIASEHLFVVLFFASLLLAVTPGVKPITRAVLSGVLLGLAVLTRGEAVFYSPIVLFAAWTTTGGSRRPKLTTAVVTLAVCVAVTLPWAIRNRVVMGPGVGLSSVAGVNFYFAHNSTQYGYYEFSDTPLAGLDEVGQHRRGFDLGLAYLSASPLRIVNDVAAGTPRLLWYPGTYAPRAGLIVLEAEPPYTIKARRKFPFASVALVTWYYRVTLLLAIAGLYKCRRIGWRAFIILYGVIVMNWVCYAVVFWSKPRFRYTTEVVTCVVAGIVLWQTWETVRSFRARPRTTP